MRIATLALTLGAVLLASGCSRFGSDSGLNPLRWLGGGSRIPATLEPEDGWARQDEARQPVPQILSAGMEPLNEGELLVVRAFAPVKGWWDLEIVTERVQPANQLRPDDDGILRLVLIGNPPLPDSPEAAMPANPAADVLTVALPISTIQLSRLRGIEIRSASGGVALRP
ncbi:hypothetical protein SAMN05421538_102108 [Paracoccus isoporae]|uniref:Lipoprotein n=1 Tax=Paracoccus isoporae TaxID=591205 RepID=A0A1G6WG32_9RHOB|nr:hypothetical protein [Paracoccus isoporae]SDD64035.1 hypothetical protein SAMN05421538_102108 [Paracoccus isoporae]